MHQKNFFLYDKSSYINQTFYTELNKNLEIYRIISTSAIGIESATKLVRLENSLKFKVVNDKYMEHIALQLEDIRKPGKIETKDAKVTIFWYYQQNHIEELALKETVLSNNRRN